MNSYSQQVLHVRVVGHLLKLAAVICLFDQFAGSFIVYNIVSHCRVHLFFTDHNFSQQGGLDFWKRLCLSALEISHFLKFFGALA